MSTNFRNIVIRVDSSTIMGMGHLMRCLTLADELGSRGAQVSFICRALPGNLAGLITEKKYPLYWLPSPSEQMTPVEQRTAHANWLGVDWQTDAAQTKALLRVITKENMSIDWLIVDHYALDIKWEQEMRPYVKKVMVIDDIADREHDCDLLLDQNLYRDMEKRYTSLVPEHCRLLLGPRYALLRPEFTAARKILRKCGGDGGGDGAVRRIFVFFGGSDPSNETTKALQAIRLLDRSDIAVDVVVGSTNPHKEQVEKLCAAMPNTNFHCQVENMAELMSRANLAIGAGGSTTWERSCLGLPTLIASIARNQEIAAETTADYGAAVYLGKAENITFEQIAQEIKKLLEKQEMVSQTGEKAMGLVDGRGGVRTGGVIFE